VLKIVHFLRTVWGTSLHLNTEPDPKQGIQKFLTYLPATFVPSLTLQSLTSLRHVTKHRDFEYGK
jgi:hypothetical protein